VRAAIWRCEDVADEAGGGSEGGLAS
jgi:hypothetical protein